MTDQPDKKRLDLDPIQVAAGTLAAVTSAVGASFLGVGGTLAGAGVGSVLATVGGAVYGHYLERTRQQVRSVVFRNRAAQSRSIPRSGTDDALTRRSSRTTEADLPAVTLATNRSNRPAAAWLRSRRFALGGSAVMTFGLALAVISGVEAATRKPVAAMVNGTDHTASSTVGAVLGGHAATPVTPPATETPTPPPTSTHGVGGDHTSTATSTTPPDSTSPEASEAATGVPGTISPAPSPGITETPAPVPTTPGVE